MTLLGARCSARARPIAARVHHRPPGARPGHDRDPDPAARKADELDWRAQPAPSHRTHPPAVAVDPGADQPTTPWLPQPDSSGRRQRRGSVTRRRCSPPSLRAVAPRPGGRRFPGPAWSGVPRPCSRRRDSRTASRPPRPRRGSRIPARSAPWVCSERVDVSAAHARRGRRAVVHCAARSLPLRATCGSDRRTRRDACPSSSGAGVTHAVALPRSRLRTSEAATRRSYLGCQRSQGKAGEDGEGNPEPEVDVRGPGADDAAGHEQRQDAGPD